MSVAVVRNRSEWLSALEPYQAALAEDLLDACGGDAQAAAERWLSMSTSADLAPFSAAGPKGSGYAQAFWDELFEFICGDGERYASQRGEFSEQMKIGRTSAVAVTSAALSPALGFAGPVLAPAIAIGLLLVSTVGVGAFCKAQRERRDAQETMEPTALGE